MTERERVLEQFRSPDSAWRTRAARDIERYRKGDFTLRVTDRAGKPIPDAVLAVTLRNHAFRFGANLFMLDEFDDAEKDALYRRKFPECFNMATIPFYWDAVEPERGKPRYDADSPRIYRRPATELCLDYCETNGIEPREHGLAYASFFPKWLHSATVEETKAALRRRFSEVRERFASRIPTLEITNELEWGDVKNAFYYERDYMEWCYKTAEEFFSDNTIAVNEWLGLSFGDRGKFNDKYYSYIENTLLKGARIDQIGFQYHTFFPREQEYEETKKYYDPEKLYRHLDLYATLDRPLELTEVTIPAYSWEAEDEEIQAELIESLYTLWFSHPKMRHIIYWNLVDGYAHVWESDDEKRRATQGNMTYGENIYYGGLLRFDLSEKPAYRRLRHLIREVWHTEEALAAKDDGKASFRGFYGDYEVAVTVGGETKVYPVSFSEDGEQVLVIE